MRKCAWTTASSDAMNLLVFRLRDLPEADHTICGSHHFANNVSFLKHEAVELFAAARGLSLHPPERTATGKRLDEYLAGSPLALD
jgi:hypothetical protein